MLDFDTYHLSCKMQLTEKVYGKPFYQWPEGLQSVDYGFPRFQWPDGVSSVDYGFGEPISKPEGW